MLPSGTGRWAVRMRQRHSAERGSLTLEFVIAVPLFILLLLFMVYAGKIVSGFGQVDGAARDAARAASDARTTAAAKLSAQQAVDADLNGVCAGGPVIDSMSGFAPGSNDVTVRITCTLNLSYLNFPNMTMHATGVAPLDQFVSRTF